MARAYSDLHEHIKTLEERGQLVRVSRPIDKDTEMHPLVRWQFRGGIPEAERKAFLFENVVDAKGKRYDIPVVVAALAASRDIYRCGIGCELHEINDRWARAMAHPIDPEVVEQAPCHDIVLTGDGLEAAGGLGSLPVPISTPGWDNAPYTTTSHFITKDPDTGVQNVGNYRGQVKAPLRLGMNPSIELRPGILVHFEKRRARGEKLPCAVVLGAPPVLSYASAQKVPEHIDEVAVAGGLVGGPLRVVKCKTVDLYVPAESEIVIEGFIDTEYLEPEGPVGESHGHVNLQEYNAFMEVTAICRRSDAILSSIISQVTPSESSLMKRVAYEALFVDHLKNHLGIRGVIDVQLHEPLTNLRKVVLVRVQRDTPTTEVWRALYGAASFQRPTGKLVVAVNDDIDADSADAILWALSYRMNPQRDMQTLLHKDVGHGPHIEKEDGAVLFDATLKGAFPPISLPKRPYMERARAIWEELGLPPLKPQAPWYGYSLGGWTEALEQEAQRATAGDYFLNGEAAQKRRRKDVGLNTDISLE